MASNKILGRVEKIGSRVTQRSGRVRVEEIVSVTIDPTDEQKTAFEKDPIALIKKLLTQEGHKFKDVKSRAGSKPVSHLRSEWYHVVYDADEPDIVCMWIKPDEGW